MEACQAAPTAKEPQEDARASKVAFDSGAMAAKPLDLEGGSGCISPACLQVLQCTTVEACTCVRVRASEGCYLGGAYFYLLVLCY